MINAFTVDVEDYWKNHSRDWLGYDAPPSRAVVYCTETLLEMLEEYNARATFFVVGEVAQKYPGLIRNIVDAGHEIASHGQEHYEINKISRKKFIFEIKESKTVIEDIAGCAVEGHRATSFTVTPATKWALEELAQAGYSYDSSIFPFQGRRYGWPGFCKDVCRVALPGGNDIIEVPMTIVEFLGKKLPACGGGYLRHFPYAYTRWAIRKVASERPFIVYVHPYDMDTSPPPTADYANVIANAELRPRIRHALQIRNRNTIQAKLQRMLKEYRFTTIKNIIAQSKPIKEFEI